MAYLSQEVSIVNHTPKYPYVADLTSQKSLLWKITHVLHVSIYGSIFDGHPTSYVP